MPDKVLGYVSGSHFPNDKAAEIALETVTSFPGMHGSSIDRVVFNIFKDKDKEIYEKLIMAPGDF